MSVVEKSEYITLREYLEGEKLSPVKHEYIDGAVYAMAGTKRPHNTVAFNIAKLVDEHLDETRCMVYFADVKVRVEAANCYYYPDVVVTCDERDSLDDTESEDDTVDDTTVLYPRLIVEVLSESTEAFDRGMKFTHYRTIETLEEYVLIRQDQMSVERYQREANGLWSIHPPLSAGEQLHLSSVDLTLPVEALYRKVRLPGAAR